MLRTVAFLLLILCARGQGNDSSPDVSPAVSESAGNNSVLGADEPPVTGPAVPENTTNAAPNNTVVASPEPAAANTGSNTSNSAGSVESPPSVVTVDKPLPFFKGVRSCLPFNILVAAPLKTADGNTIETTNGRITITADPSVINSTAVAVEDDILTLSLVGNGVFSVQPIKFIVSGYVVL